MARCPSESERLRWVAGELTGSARAEMESHLAECSECSRQVTELGAMWRSMDAWRVDVGGHDVLPRVLAAAADRSENDCVARWKYPWAWPVPIRAAASILLAAGIGWSAARAMPRPALAPFPSEIPLAAQPSEEVVADDVALYALTGGTPTGVASTFLDDETELSEQEDRG